MNLVASECYKWRLRTWLILFCLISLHTGIEVSTFRWRQTYESQAVGQHDHLPGQCTSLQGWVVLGFPWSSVSAVIQLHSLAARTGTILKPLGSRPCCPWSSSLLTWFAGLPRAGVTPARPWLSQKGWTVCNACTEESLLSQGRDLNLRASHIP